MDVKMLVATLPADANMAEWCRRLGISRQTAYKWRRRFAEEGAAGLNERSRAPRSSPTAVAAAVEDEVVAARKWLQDEGLDAGAASVQSRLVEQGLDPPSDATIWRILVRRGQVTPQPRKRPKKTYRRFERSRPNECWQGDDTHYRLATGVEVRIINMIDDHSRLNVDSLAAVACTSLAVLNCFWRAAERHGVPAEFLNDNGRAYVSGRGGESPSKFQVGLAGLGVHHIRSSPYHPETCGKVERFHQTQRRWLDARPAARTIAELQELLDEFRSIYNTRRPHRSLGRRTPASVWAAQPAATPTRAANDPPAVVTTHRIFKNGCLSIGTSLSIAVGAYWIGEPVILVRRGDHATVVHADTGEVIRELVIDHNRRNQPRGVTRGGGRKPRRSDPKV